MKTREEYDNIINDLKTKLGDNFASVSDIIADLSNDYDTVIQADKDYNDRIQNLDNQRVQLLETNNKLFTQVTNNKAPSSDPVITQKKQEQDTQDERLNINNIINEEGELE